MIPYMERVGGQNKKDTQGFPSAAIPLNGESQVPEQQQVGRRLARNMPELVNRERGRG